MNRTELMQALMRQGLAQSGAPQSPIGSVANILAAAIMGGKLGKTMKAEDAKSASEKDYIAKALAGTTQRPDAQISLDPVTDQPNQMGPPSPDLVSTIAYKPELNKEAYNNWKNMPQDVLVQAMANRMTPKPGEAYTLGPDDVRFGPDNKPVAIGAGKTKDRPSSAQEFGLYLGKEDPSEWTPDERVAYRNFLDRKGINVTTTVQSGENALASAGGKMIAERLDKSYEEADKASRSLPYIQRAKTLLDEGILTGAGAETIAGLGTIAQTLGIQVDPKISNTNEYRSIIGKQVAESIKAFGAGTGLSDADREYAERMAGGKINIDEAALKRILGIANDATESVIKSYNSQRNRIKDPQMQDFYPVIGIPDSKVNDLKRRIGGQ